MGKRYTSEATRGLGSVVTPPPAPPSGVEAESRSKTGFGAFWVWKKSCDNKFIICATLLHIKFDFIWSRAFNPSAFYPRVSAIQQCDNSWITLLDEVKSSEPTEDTSDLAGFATTAWQDLHQWHTADADDGSCATSSLDMDVTDGSLTMSAHVSTISPRSTSYASICGPYLCVSCQNTATVFCMASPTASFGAFRCYRTRDLHWQFAHASYSTRISGSLRPRILHMTPVRYCGVVDCDHLSTININYYQASNHGQERRLVTER